MSYSVYKSILQYLTSAPPNLCWAANKLHRVLHFYQQTCEELQRLVATITQGVLIDTYWTSSKVFRQCVSFQVRFSSVSDLRACLHYQIKVYTKEPQTKHLETGTCAPLFLVAKDTFRKCIRDCYLSTVLSGL